MPFDNLRDFKLSGPALPEPFVRLQLEDVLKKKKLLPAAKDVKTGWDIYRRHLRRLGEVGGSRRVKNHVLDPLVELLGYATIEQAQEVETREGPEDGGFVMKTADGTSLLRCWTAGVNTDLDAPTRRGRAFRFSLQNIALRVLWKQGERAGLITDGDELRLIIVNPSGRESFITFDLTRSGWRGAYTPPDSFRLFLALSSPEGIAFIPDLTEQARLAQAEVTKTLRDQARNAITDFLQGVLQHHQNQAIVSNFPIRYVKKHHRTGGVDHAQIADPATLANELWREGLIIVYRLLFILKLESSPDPARAFSFASTSLWRNTYSPNTALSSWVKVVLDERKDTGSLMEDGLRSLFRLFVRGLKSSELHVSPLGGQLFGPDTTPLLDQLKWGEQSVALLLQHLLWTPETKKSPRMRVHYGYLDVEDLGRVYEALLEREPGIATERMCRLKRDKLEVVVPHAQGEAYRTATTKSKVEWVEEIPAGRFYLRVGLGRKSSGSYYTPDAFVKFLVQETLGPLSTERSPLDDPHPAALLTIKVLDPAMGSGHFLVEACRFLGERLYEACRRCDELALTLQAAADAKEEGKRIDDRAVLKELDAALLDLSPAELRARAEELYRRVEILPDPNDELLQYLPSRSVEGGETSGVSVWKARALCRRLVAVHCLYGVDKNPLAVELAKLVLWMESYSEGYPLTFLDHRLIQGDSLTGPFFKHLLQLPVSRKPFDDMWTTGLEGLLKQQLINALTEVKALEKSIGLDVADLGLKSAAKARLDDLLADLRMLACAWSGGVMLGKDHSTTVDAAYEEAVQTIANDMGVGRKGHRLQALREVNLELDEMIHTGAESVPYDLRFPEVFWREGEITQRAGFDVLLGNPPWDRIETSEESYWGNFDLRALEVDNTYARADIISEVSRRSPEFAHGWRSLCEEVDRVLRATDRLFSHQRVKIGRSFTTGRPDLYRLFAEQVFVLSRQDGFIGQVLHGAFHSNEGAAGLRRLYLDQSRIISCFSFENRNRLFEIDIRSKFDLLIARKHDSGTDAFHCGFYLQELVWLANQEGALRYTRAHVETLGGDYLAFAECRDQQTADLMVAQQSQETLMIGSLEGLVIRFGVELHRNPPFSMGVSEPLKGIEAAYSMPPIDDGCVPVFEGKCFNQYTDDGDGPVSFQSPWTVAREKSKWNPATSTFRLAYREVASSTNERTLIVGILRPGTITNHTVGIEVSPFKRSNGWALSVLAAMNSHTVDWQVRQRATTHVSAFVFRNARLHRALLGWSFLAHSALRLSCNHSGYEPLWREQLCYTPELEGTWREKRPPFIWPVLEGDEARWLVRAAIDAVVAQAYGLTKDQYEHILNSFSHKSYPAAKAVCLDAWDELHALGLDAFTKKHDPYHDIPLNEALPQPVINLPGLADLDGAEGDDDAELIEMMEDDSPDSDDGEEEITRPAAKKPKKTPAKVVEVANDWWVEFLDVPAETLVTVAAPEELFGEAAFDLGSEPEPAWGIRLLGDGRLELGQPDKDMLVSLKPIDRTLEAKSLESIRTTINRAAGLEELPLDDRIEYRAGSRVQVVRVAGGGRVRVWKAPDGAWPKKFKDTIASLARALREEAQKDRKE